MKNITQKITKHAVYLVIALLVGVMSVHAVIVPPLTPTGTPGDDTHFSLKDIEDKLVNFTDTPTATSSPFSVPGSVSETFPTLSEIYHLLTAENADLVPGKIATGTTIFGVTGTVVEGTLIRSQWSTDNRGPGAVDWTNAVSACSNLVEGGHSDWELPTSIEIHNAYLTSVSGFQSDTYWSSTDFVSDLSRAYTEDMGFGFVSSFGKSNNFLLVRCVR